MTCHFPQAISPFVSQHSNPNQAAPAVFSAAPLTLQLQRLRLPKSPNHPCSTARPRRCRHGHAGNSRRSHLDLGFPFPLAPPLLRAHARPVQCCRPAACICGPAGSAHASRHHIGTTHYRTIEAKLRRNQHYCSCSASRLASIRTPHRSRSTHCTGRKRRERWRGRAEGEMDGDLQRSPPCASAAHTARSPNYRRPRSKPNHHLNPTSRPPPPPPLFALQSAPSSSLSDPQTLDPLRRGGGAAVTRRGGGGDGGRAGGPPLQALRRQAVALQRALHARQDRLREALRPGQEALRLLRAPRLAPPLLSLLPRARLLILLLFLLRRSPPRRRRGPAHGGREAPLRQGRRGGGVRG